MGPVRNKGSQSLKERPLLRSLHLKEADPDREVKEEVLPKQVAERVAERVLLKSQNDPPQKARRAALDY